MISATLSLQKQNFRLDASFEVPERGVTGVYGPSGCGKTTLLRALAGFEPTTTGQINMAGTTWLAGQESLPVADRRAGFVFQDAGIFPHLTVRENLYYALKRSKKAPYQFEFNHICDLLQVGNLLQRSGAVLSGGERQRVAIARALLGSPAILFMDEPLSAVDQGGRKNLIQILENVLQEIDIPVFYVSHSSEEISRLSENLILMEAGQIRGYGNLQQVLGEVNSPLNASEESFSVLQCAVAGSTLPFLTSVLSTGGALLHIPTQGLAADAPVRLRIRARDVSLTLEAASSSSILNILPATVIELSQPNEKGSRTIKLDLAGDCLLARISEYSVQQLAIQPGSKVYAQIKSVSLI